MNKSLLRWSLAFVAATVAILLVSLLAATASFGAPGVAAYAYDSQGHSARAVDTATVRGPLAHDHLTTYHGADTWPHGVSARPEPAGSHASYTYNGCTLVASGTRVSGTRQPGTHGDSGTLPSLAHSDGAANTGTRVAETCLNSFTGDTLVLMADGTKKPIKDVRLGDKVMATDPITGERGARKVIDLIRHSGSHTMVAIHLADGTTIDATDHHPFWVESRHEWVDAIHLQFGDVVIDVGGDELTVRGVGISQQDVTAYNLTVEGLHTYFAGSDSVLVHNAGCANITESGLAHSFDRHAAQWFGGQPTKAGQMAEWQGLIERTSGSSKVVPWSSGGTPTNAYLARVDGKYFAAQFDRETGDLVTAFVTNNDQLGAMLGLLGH